MYDSRRQSVSALLAVALALTQAPLAHAQATASGSLPKHIEARAGAAYESADGRVGRSISQPALETHLAAHGRRVIQAVPRALPSADALFDWAERVYPQYFPSHRATQKVAPYTYRHYPETGNYVGLDGEDVVVLGPVSGHQILVVGTRSDFACQVTPSACSPIALTGRIAVGTGHSMAVKADGTVLRWGEPWHSATGNWVPGTMATQLVNPKNIVGVRVGQRAYAAIDANGLVHNWGYNYFGALGVTPEGFGDELPQPVQNPLIGAVNDLVIDGVEHEMITIFVRRDGSVGYTPKERGHGPVAVGTVVGLSGVVSLSGGRGADYLVTRGYAVKSDGTVWALKWKEIFAGGAWQYQLAAERLPGVEGMAQVSCVTHYCVATAKDGSVWGWGDGSNGVLGDGTGISRDRPVRALGLSNAVRVLADGSASYAITKDGALYGWGYMSGGVVSHAYYREHAAEFLRPQLIVESRFGVVDVAVGGAHALLVLKDGSVWGWGNNSMGEIGDGTKDTYDGKISRVMGINLN